MKEILGVVALMTSIIINCAKDNTIIEEQIKDNNNGAEIVERQTYQTRLTSYYTGDECESTNTTASGLTTDSFETNNKGWYTYQNKLVVATASTRLKGWEISSESHIYNLYDEITLIIDGERYNAIVLDVCGSCLFVILLPCM